MLGGRKILKMTFTEQSTARIFSAIRDTEDRPNPLRTKLQSFRRLPRGWSHGEGVPASADAVRAAEKFVDTAATLQLKADVFPGLNGEIAVAFYQGNKCVEVVIKDTDLQNVELHVEEGRGFNFRRIESIPAAPYPEAISKIASLIKDSWKSPASSRSSSLMETGVAFRTFFSSTHQG